MKRYLVVEHKIGDYEQWKRVFDESEERRREAGFLGGWIYRNSEDSKDLVVVLECTDVERAREFMKSKYLREAMERAGVEGNPSIRFLDEIATVPSLATAGVDLEYD